MVTIVKDTVFTIIGTGFAVVMFWLLADIMKEIVEIRKGKKEDEE